MKRLLYLVIFLIFSGCLYVFAEIDKNFVKWNNCPPTEMIIHLYWFNKDNKFEYKHFGPEDHLQFDNEEGYVKSMILTCICRKSLDPIFFVLPYFDDRKLEDIYVYCVLGNLSSHGIYDEYEAYDTLLFQKIQAISHSLMTPFVDENEDASECLDVRGYRTKKIANQKTCLFALNVKTNQIYSGPLLIRGMQNLGIQNIANQFTDICFTTLNDSIIETEDKCRYMSDKSLFFCCCAKEPEKCGILIKDFIDSKKLFCRPSKEKEELSVQEYQKDYINSTCNVKIITLNKIYTYEYYASNTSCSSNNGILYSVVLNTGLCSTSDLKQNQSNAFFHKCCQNGHFCNNNIYKPIRLREDINKCAYKPEILQYFDESGTCELYFDLTSSRRVSLHQNITSTIIHKEKFVNTQSDNGSSYSCGFVYAKIINFDSQNGCKDVKNTILPLYYCTCKDYLCDNLIERQKIKQNGQNKIFECQNLAQTDIENAKKRIIKKEKDKWICYVQITNFLERPKINAGFLDSDGEKFIECLKTEVINDPEFCCVNIMNRKQSDTECTVEKQLERFTKSIENQEQDDDPSKNNNNTNPNHFDLKHIHCYSNDIFGVESQYCPKTDGCFSTRSLQTSQNSTNNIEPAGCSGLAENYITQNLPLASVSLGCRAGENSNRCSVVQAPDGQQRVVCCCDEIDKNGLCNTNLNKVPTKIGRTISSFKN